MGLCGDGCHGLHHGSRVRRGALLYCWTFVPQNADRKLGVSDAGCMFREFWQGEECVSFITI